jgi:hypothetical protein
MTISFARLGRIAGVAVTALTLTGGLAGTGSAATFTGHDTQAGAAAMSPAVSGYPMCLDAGNPPRRNNGLVTLWRCEAGNANQVWVIDGGQVRVKDTIATAIPMCLDAGRPPRRNGGLVTLWRCEAGNANQVWVIDGGQVKVKDTIATATPMCLDAGRPPRRNGGLVTLWKCQAGNANQVWVIDGGQVKVKDTLS